MATPDAWRRRALAAVLAAGLLGARDARAGTEAFAAACLADGGDVRDLSRRLAAAGFTEVDPAQGPQGPALAQAPGGRRLWSSRREGRETYVGRTAAGPGRSVEICWSVSRPGESAAASLVALKRRFPPAAAPETGAAFFYGGYERWPVRLGDGEAFLAVEWPLRADPGAGVGVLSLTRVPTAASRAGSPGPPRSRSPAP